MNELNEIKNHLLNREENVFMTDIKEVFDDAVHDTSKRNVLGPGVGAAFVCDKTTKALRKRMKEISEELSTIELGKKDLDSIQINLSKQYIKLFLSIMAKPAAWGKVDSESYKKLSEAWIQNSQKSLEHYFEKEYKAATTKRRISKSFTFRKTLFWLVVGALIGSIDKLYNLLLKIIETIHITLK